MEWVQEIRDEVKCGARILAAQPSHRRAHEAAMEIVRNHPDLVYRYGTLFVEHPSSGGFIHLAVDDDHVLGMEYHRSVGTTSPVMRSRVRLPYVPKEIST